MTLPHSVRIGYMTYRVIETDDWTTGPLAENEQRFGEIDMVRQEIHIRPGLSAAAAKDTLLHETLHGVWAEVGLLDGDSQTEERLTLALTPRLIELLRRNPNLVDSLLAK